MNIKAIFILIFLFQLSLCAFSQTKVEEAQKYFEDSKYKKALKIIEDDISEQGLSEENSVLKSRILLYIDGDLCFESIQNTISKYPESLEAYELRAFFYFKLGDLRTCIEDQSRALELAKVDSVKVSCLITRTGYYTNNNQIDEALKDIKIAYSLDSNNIGVLNNYAIALQRNKRFEEALTILLKMIEIEPDNVLSLINLGYVNQKMENYEEAEKYLLEGLAMEDKNPYLLNNIGYVQHKLGKTDEGIKNINKSLKVDSDNSYCYRNLALIYLDLGDNDKSCENVKLAIKYGFSIYYGNEMKDLEEKNCL